MTKLELAKALQTNTDYLTREQALEVIGILTDTISKSLVKGDPVFLRGFGTFNPVERASHVARNMKTGKMMTLPAYKTIKFIVGKDLKEQLK